MKYELHKEFEQTLWDNLKAAAAKETAVLERYCQSPLEITFGFAASFVARMFLSRPLFLLAEGQYVPELDRYPQYFYMRPQFQIGRHRVDFLMGISTLENEAVVELDGREFHHSTREQIERDRKRDQEIEASDYKVFRFPGTQVYNKPLDCAADVIDWLLHCEEPDPR